MPPNFGHRLQRRVLKYDASAMSSTTRSTIYRAASPSRPKPPISRSNVAALTQFIQSGRMNLSHESQLRSRTTTPIAQPPFRRTARDNSISSQRAKLPSQNPSVRRSLHRNGRLHLVFVECGYPSARPHSLRLPNTKPSPHESQQRSRCAANK